MARQRGPDGAVHLPIAGEPRPERADAARNRKLLLDVAARIVHDHGVAGLSMEAVAEAAGVGIGTVYRRFGERSGLAYALIDEQERAFQAEMLSGAPPLGPGAPPAERLRAFAHRYVDRLTDQSELVAAAESARYESGAYRLQRLHLVRLITQIDPDLDAEYHAAVLLEVLSGRLHLHLSHDVGMSAGRVKAGLDQLLRGILK